jgi:hypothetical protein
MTTVVVPNIKLDSVEETALDETTWEFGKEPRFNANHRCDRCGAQAYVEAGLRAGVLLFCSHHANAARPKMEAAGVLVKWYSEAGRMQENRTQGSEN